MSGKTPVWEPQEGETAAAYAAFCAYRDLGPERTALQAYRQTKSKPEANQAAGAWTAWSTKHQWRERAEAYDRHIEEAARKKADSDVVARRAEMLKRHRQAAELMQRRGIEHFAKHEVENARDAIAAIAKGVDLERQVEGLPSYVVEILNADESDLRRMESELDARRRAVLVDGPESAGDALAVSESNGKHSAGILPTPSD